MMYREQYKERTKVEINKLPSLHINDKSISIGSCFSEHLSTFLQMYHYKHSSNPYGIIFNPLSILKILERAVTLRYFSASEFIERDGQFLHFDMHSSMSSNNLEQLINRCNTTLSQLNQDLKDSRILYLTYGTAEVYVEKESQNIVANCHKFPSTHFAKKRLVPHEIISPYNKLINELQSLNPYLRIIFTVSPIRHTRIGIHQNNLSKSVLLLAVDEIISQNEHCYYFPSYELLLDELRDYKFYSDDLIHPSDRAVEIIINRYVESSTDESTKAYLRTLNAFYKLKAHRVLSSDLKHIEGHQEKVNQESEKIKHRYPHLGGVSI